MKKLIITIIISLTVMLLFADDFEERRFFYKVSAGPSISWVSDFNPGWDIDYDMKIPFNFHVGLSLMPNNDRCFNFQPGIRFITRNWGNDFYTARGYMGLVPVFFEVQTNLYHLDVYCLLKYRILSKDEIKINPFIGFSNSILLHSRIKSVRESGHSEIIEIEDLHWLNRINMFFLVGIELKVRYVYTMTIEYNQGYQRLGYFKGTEWGLTNEEKHLHTLTLSIGRLF